MKNQKRNEKGWFFKTINNLLVNPYDTSMSPSGRWEEKWEEPEYERPWKPQEFNNKKIPFKRMVFRYTRVHLKGTVKEK